MLFRSEFAKSPVDIKDKKFDFSVDLSLIPMVGTELMVKKTMML